MINGLNGDEITGTLYKKELQKKNQKEFRIKRVIKRKGYKVYGKEGITCLIVGLIKKM